MPASRCSSTRRSSRRPAAERPTCTVCKQPIPEEYYEINGKMMCPRCRHGVEAAFRGGSPAGTVLLGDPLRRGGGGGRRDHLLRVHPGHGLEPVAGLDLRRLHRRQGGPPGDREPRRGLLSAPGHVPDLLEHRGDACPPGHPGGQPQGLDRVHGRALPGPVPGGARRPDRGDHLRVCACGRRGSSTVRSTWSSTARSAWVPPGRPPRLPRRSTMDLERDSTATAAALVCPSCGSEVAPNLLSCPSCHRLVHAERLKELAELGRGLGASR